MNDEDYQRALNQLAQLESFAALWTSLPNPPVSMPDDPVRAAGVDPTLWLGLGVVGIWGGDGCVW